MKETRTESAEWSMCCSQSVMVYIVALVPSGCAPRDKQNIVNGFTRSPYYANSGNRAGSIAPNAATGKQPQLLSRDQNRDPWIGQHKTRRSPAKARPSVKMAKHRDEHHNGCCRETATLALEIDVNPLRAAQPYKRKSIITTSIQAYELFAFACHRPR